jgi:CTP synthase
MVASGVNPKTGLVEAIELPQNNWFVGVQYHPEYSSTVANPHPLFVAFVQAVNAYAQSKK